MGENKPLGMIHAARMMRKYGHPNRKLRAHSEPQTPDQKKLSPVAYRDAQRDPDHSHGPNDVKVLPDSWLNNAPRPREESVQTRKRTLQDQIIDAQVAQLKAQKQHASRRRERLSQSYTRTCKSVSLSMTRTEEEALREHAKGLNMSFSKWARIILFTAAGVPIPEERKKRR